MSRDSGSGDPSQRTVAELLAEHGGGSSSGSRRRRRRAEDPSETAPQAIIDRVNSDSGRMRPITDEPAPEQSPETPETQQAAPSNGQAPPAQPQQAQPPHPAREPVNPPPAARESRPRQAERPAPQPQPPEPQAADPHEAVRSEPPAEAGPAGAPDQAGRAGGKFGPWARRLGPGSSESRRPKLRRPANKAPTEQDTPNPESDSEITAQQAPVADPGTTSAPRSAEPERREAGAGRQPGSPSAWAAARAPQKPQADSATEQFPPVANPAAQAGPAATDGDGTALLDYPGPSEQEPYGADTGTADPYTTGYNDPYELDPYADDPSDPYADDLYDGTPADAAFAEDPDSAPDDRIETEDDEPEELYAPAGMATDDVDEDVDHVPRSAAREWLILAAQITGGLVGGGAVWVGFRWLWTALPIAALVAALIVTGVLVLIARKFLRSDDLQTILLSVLVGLMCTVSPVVLLLVGY